MKKKIFLILGIVFLIILRILYGLSPWLKYRSVSQWSPDITHYRPEIMAGTDSVHHLVGSFSTFSQCRRVPWLGYSSNEMKYQDGFHNISIPKEVFGYDTNLIVLAGNNLDAKKSGRTNLLIRLPNKVDTLAVHVKNEDSIVVIQ